MNVAIFGGGIAGLTTAVALHSRGYACQVYERRPGYAGNGMGFIVSPTVLSHLTEAGLALPPAETGVLLRRYRQYRPDGEPRQVRDLPPGWRAVRRTHLLRHLRDQLPPGTVVPGAALTHLALRPDRTVAEAYLDSEQGVRRLPADLYVAADGAHSVARRVLFPDRPHRLARVWEIVAIAGHTMVCEWAGTDFHKFSAPGIAAGLVPVGDRTLVWYIQFDRRRVGHDGTALDKLAHELVGDWAYPIPELLRVTDFGTAHLWRPVDADLLPRFHTGNLALVGDAAHPLLPFTSQGVATAVAGARDLATALAGHGSMADALAAYSRSCLTRCAPFVPQGRELSRRFLNPPAGTDDPLPIAT